MRRHLDSGTEQASWQISMLEIHVSRLQTSSSPSVLNSSSIKWHNFDQRSLPAVTRMAPADKLTQLQKSLKAYDGHFTRALRSAERLCHAMARYQHLPSEVVVQATSDNIKRRQGLVIALLEQLYGLDPDDTYLTGLDDTTTRGAEAIDRLMEAKKVATAQFNAQQQEQVLPTHVGQANDALKPFLLTLEHTPGELRDWKKQFDLYYLAGHMDTWQYTEQVAYLRACIDKELFRHIGDQIEKATSIMDAGGAIAILDAEFQKQYPLSSRRLKYFCAQPPQGMLASEWLDKLLRMGDEADLDTLSVDQLHVFRYIASVQDPDLRFKFCQLREPTIQQLKELAFAHECAVRQMKLMSSSPTCVSKAKHMAALSHAQANKNTVSCKNLRGKCFRCGNTNHKTKDCPRKNLTCHACGKPGHIAAVCLSQGPRKQQSQRYRKKNKKAPLPPLSPAPLHQVHDMVQQQRLRGTPPRCHVPTPRIQVVVRPLKERHPLCICCTSEFGCMHLCYIHGLGTNIWPGHRPWSENETANCQ